MDPDEPGLSIADVARRTGLRVAQLRAWESRHGFPRPERLANGHRRYRPADVAAIERVLRDREAGLSLDAAIRRSSPDPAGGTGSVFAELRRDRPDLPVHRLSQRAMLAVSRAIEDEMAASGDRPVLVGGFEAERFYRRSEARWRELARTATATLVFADFTSTAGPGGGSRPAGGPGPIEVPLPAEAVLRREWLVACLGSRASAVVAGRELPGPGTPAGRWFEATWSAERTVAARAVAVAVELARRLAPGVDLPTAPGTEPGDPGAAVRRATALTNRIVSYLD